MPFSKPFDAGQLQAFLIAIGIGLLIGLERERVTSARAGLRTFGLVGLLGALIGLLGEHFDSVAPFVFGLAILGVMIIAAYLRHPDATDPGTTSVAALLLCYCLGTAVWLGHATIAVMLAVATTILLYFKAELRGIATRLESKDWISIIQFSVLSLVILPILPDRPIDPQGAVSPRQVWWMVVLISGLSLAGYAVLRLVGARYGAALVGIAGGLASSTATTLIHARDSRVTPASTPVAALVIILANVVMMIRIAVIAAVVAPGLLAKLAIVVLPALVLGLGTLIWYWRIPAGSEAVLPQTRNPTELRAALGFGVLYAVILFVSAWLSDIVGTHGLYALAAVSGLADMDAIALSSMRLFSLDRLAADAAAIAIGVAMIANLGFKTVLAVALGGQELGKRISRGMSAIGLGLAAGTAWLALSGTGL